MTSSEEYVIWLPSWYPNEFEPYNGDFIQRHAIATSNYCKIVVFHFVQLGSATHLNADYFKKDEMSNLKEFKIAPAFKPIGISLIDKVRYNYKFYTSAKSVLKQYFKENGLPKIVHVHVPIKAGNLALWIKRKYNIDYILSEQASHYMEISPDSFFKKNFYYKNQAKKIFTNAKKVSNVSHAIGNILKRLFNLKKVITIHNTVNTNLFYYEPKDNQTFVYLHVSSLSEQKNIYGMLNAFERLSSLNKDWVLQIIGPCNNELELFVKNKSLDGKIQIIGEVPYTSVATYMRKANSFVLFSKHENFPCVIVEALCCGLPTIAADVAGIREAINMQNGILVNSQNEDELLAALIKIKEDYNSYNRLEISKNATDLYNYKEIGKQIFNLYSITT